MDAVNRTVSICKFECRCFHAAWRCLYTEKYYVLHILHDDLAAQKSRYCQMDIRLLGILCICPSIISTVYDSIMLQDEQTLLCCCRKPLRC